MPKALGLDFGTTNTVLSQIQSDGKARPVVCPIDGAPVEALRSALCFWQTSARDGRQLRVEAGPYAIRQFIDHPGECRFIQSFKTFGASPHFQGTYVYGKRYKFEDLLEFLLARIRDYESSDSSMNCRRVWLSAARWNLLARSPTRRWRRNATTRRCAVSALPKSFMSTSLWPPPSSSPAL